MPDRLLHAIGSIPFFMLLSDDHGKKYIQLNKTRVVEAVIISCITGIIAGGVAGTLSLNKLEVKMDNIEKKVDQLDVRLWQHSQERTKYEPIKELHISRTVRNRYGNNEYARP